MRVTRAASSRFSRTAIALVLLLTSCRPAEVVTRIPADHARLRGIVTIYVYAAAELGRPPRSVEELLPIFDRASIDDPNKTLTSKRDGQPFVIIWGVDVTGRYAGADVPLAYESEGVNGVRLVVTCGQQIKEVSEEDFANLPWPDGYEPQP